MIDYKLLKKKQKREEIIKRWKKKAMAVKQY